MNAKAIMAMSILSAMIWPAHANSPLALSSSDVARELISTQSEIDAAMAQIKSAKDLKRHLATAPASPINKLPTPDRRKFLDSLVFTRHGLASYSYEALSRASVSDVYRILALFGEQSALSTIPGAKPSTDAERSALFMSTLSYNDPTDQMPLPDSSCIVSSDGTWCETSYGSNCNNRCK